MCISHMFPVSLDNFNYLLLAATVYYVFLFAKAFILAFIKPPEVDGPLQLPIIRTKDYHKELDFTMSR